MWWAPEARQPHGHPTVLVIHGSRTRSQHGDGVAAGGVGGVTGGDGPATRVVRGPRSTTTLQAQLPHKQHLAQLATTASGPGCA